MQPFTDSHRGSPSAAGDPPDDSLHALSSYYTPRQREKVLKGLRILARVAIRSYMEEQTRSLAESDEEAGAIECEGERETERGAED